MMVEEQVDLSLRDGLGVLIGLALVPIVTIKFRG